MAETAATRSAALALADERALMRQGYQFLDEKRMLLAAEMLRRLREHQALEAALLVQLQAARAALQAALLRHGLAALQAYPPPTGTAPADTGLPLRRSPFLGVLLWAGSSSAAEPSGHGEQRGSDAAIDASPQAQACGEAFRRLLGPLARLALSAGNLERLAAEYRRTERRARALENVLLPEIDAGLKALHEHLDLADQEEAVRIRVAAARR